MCLRQQGRGPTKQFTRTPTARKAVRSWTSCSTHPAYDHANGLFETSTHIYGVLTRCSGAPLKSRGRVRVRFVFACTRACVFLVSEAGAFLQPLFLFVPKSHLPIFPAMAHFSVFYFFKIRKKTAPPPELHCTILEQMAARTVAVARFVRVVRQGVVVLTVVYIDHTALVGVCAICREDIAYTQTWFVDTAGH